MSVSLYYTAHRYYPMTEQEQTSCNKIAERYDACNCLTKVCNPEKNVLHTYVYNSN